ncbi:lipocalin-like domain-containing protein [Ferrimonas lipolytica]|uniref:AttH domain-containing protein n=1 Tax=Ferrimonas lipolytica TaxID=2724191 RepID=A0A6H1UCN0_9GAMM|nr:lipocalin-like domain-containing protein [Ferrimonas lipolytica]QIZ76598.1 hypothetical protein HER31_06795 [Ferrimonas lipolytica]
MTRVLVVLLFAIAIGGCSEQPTNEGINDTSNSRGAKVVAGKPISFPKDHGPHNDYGLEWWYLTANVTDQNGLHHGIQYTLFRFLGPTADQGEWWDGQWYMGHLMWEHQGQHLAWERFGRGVGQAGVVAMPFAAWVDDWRLQSVGDDYLPLALTATTAELTLDLVLADSPLVLHGDQGFSDKSGDGSLASYYYSLPRLQVSGSISADGEPFQVNGTAWLDREWSSALLDDRFSGWDWLALNFDDGDNMMLFCLRGDGHASNCEATWIDANGTVSTFGGDRFSLAPSNFVEVDGGDYPLEWRVVVPHKEIDVMVRSRSNDQLNRLSTTYWEGPTIISGSNSGYGFIEMTGRGEDFR